MRITKYSHSCLLVETPQSVGLIDPGNHAYANHLSELAELATLDHVVITHEHLDHMYIPLVWMLADKFPSLEIFTNESAGAELRRHGLDNIHHLGTSAVGLFEARHESAEPFSPPPPPNFGVHYQDRLTHPGDCQHIAESASVLALPVTGSWGTPAQAAELITQVSPEYVLPIHDSFWNDDSRLRYYTRFDEFCKERGVVFLHPVDGQPIEIV